MSQLTQMAYFYDGTFAGFLTCIYECYVNKEDPVCFFSGDDPRITLWPERAVVSDEEQARRVYQSFVRRISPEAQKMIREGFLTCMEEKERRLYEFIRLGYRAGPSVTRDLTDDRVAAVWKALQHLGSEVHLLKGFVRFSEQDGLLVSEIEPKNRVLPLLRPHFCARYSGERLVIYDRTHREALFYQPGQWAIVPMDAFHVSAPGETERDYRRLWRRFYDTIAIEGRYNPKLRMTHMPKRYWNTMTEFQTEDGGRTLFAPADAAP